MRLDTPTSFGAVRPKTTPAAWTLAALVIGNAGLWTLYAVLGGHPLQHQDSLEAFAWGREFQLGYYKHPPLWAWIAGAWFTIFPRQDWAFYFLSELNASLGVLGVWFLLGRFVKGSDRTAGTLLVLMTTLFSFNALRFNANTFPLSVWPWTMYVFVRSLETRTIRHGIAFGAFCGFALLSKYYGSLLLVTCAIAALVHADRRRYFLSAAPYVTLLAFEAVIAPHGLWLVRDGYQPVFYLLTRLEQSDLKFVDSVPGFILACMLFHALQLALVLAARWRGGASESAPSLRHGLPFVAILALGPLALTVLVGLVGHTRLTPLYAVPIFSLTPFLMMRLIRPDTQGLQSLIKPLYAVIVAICLLAAPHLTRFGYGIDKTRGLEPLKEVATVASERWATATKAPLHLVAGSWPYSTALAFYGSSNLSEFTEFSTRLAPWVTDDKIAKEGLLYICKKDDARCLDRSSRYQTAATQRSDLSIAPRPEDKTGILFNFTIGIVPPADQK